MTRDLTSARVLTVRQPWAHAVAWLGKDVENRVWLPYAGVDQLLILAGQRTVPEAVKALTGLGYRLDGMVTSAIVAVADIAGVCEESRWYDRPCRCGVWAQPGFCHWRLGNVRRLTEPVPALGSQGLRRPSRALLNEVASRVPSSPSFPDVTP